MEWAFWKNCVGMTSTLKGVQVGFSTALLRGTFLSCSVDHHNVELLKTELVPLCRSGRGWGGSGKSPGGGKH